MQRHVILCILKCIFTKYLKKRQNNNTKLIHEQHILSHNYSKIINIQYTIYKIYNKYTIYNIPL